MILNLKQKEQHAKRDSIDYRISGMETNIRLSESRYEKNYS